MNTEELREIDPINTRQYQGKTVVDEYTYGEVFVDEIPRDFRQSGVNFEKGKQFIRWEYRGKPAIAIGRRKVYSKGDADLVEAQNQAFFALSILADHGYVSRWSKL